MLLHGRAAAQFGLHRDGERSAMEQRPVLLVEDDPNDVVLTLRALQKQQLNHDVIVVRDGVEALEYLEGSGAFAGRDPSRLPSLILLDLKLPRLGGLELLERLADITALRNIRVVVLTSSREDEDIVRSYRHGACSYVRKPVDFEEFLQAVGELGTYWLKRNEPVPV